MKLKNLFGIGHLHWTSNLLREFRLDSVLVNSGRHNEIQHTGRYKQGYFPSVLKAEVRDQVPGWLGSVRAHFLTGRRLPSCCVFTCPFLGGCLDCSKEQWSLTEQKPKDYEWAILWGWGGERKTMRLGQEKCWFLCSCVDWHLCDFLVRRMLGHPWKWCFLYL